MIGIFDSGLGGLSVLAAIARALPRADCIYLADTAHVPYGDKHEEAIRGRVLAIGRHLVEQGCTLLVVACNTATAHAVTALREQHPGIPVVGVEPGVKPAAQHSRSKRIVVLATESTARSERLARLVRDHAAQVDVRIQPCPGWATRVETLHLNDAAFVDDIRRKVEPHLAAGADRVVLGCTHYAFLIPLLEPLVRGRAELVDVAAAVARQVVRLHQQPNGSAHLALHATARPEQLHAALPALGLGWLADRAAGATLVSA